MPLIAIHSDELESIQTIMGGGKGRKKERINIGGSWHQRRRLEAGTETRFIKPGLGIPAPRTNNAQQASNADQPTRTAAALKPVTSSRAHT